MRGRLQGGHADPRRPDYRLLVWLASVLVWLLVAVAGTLLVCYYWVPPPPQDFDAAIRSGMDAIGLRRSDWTMALDAALQICIPTMQFSLLLALVVVTASLAASGTTWLIEVAARRGWLSRGRR